MEIWLLLLVAVLIVVLLHKFFKGTLKIVFAITIAIGIVLLIYGFFVIKDANNFREDFGTSKNIFVLSDNEEFITAVILDFSNIDDEIISFENLDWLKENPGDVPEGYYKVFIVTRDALEENDEEIVDTGYADLAKGPVIDALFSEDPRYSLGMLLAEHYGVEFQADQVDATFGSAEEVRQAIFIATLLNIFGTSPMNLIEGVKNGNIIIYPETLMFKTIKHIPVSIFEQAEKIVEE